MTSSSGVETGAVLLCTGSNTREFPDFVLWHDDYIEQKIAIFSTFISPEYPTSPAISNGLLTNKVGKK